MEHSGADRRPCVAVVDDDPALRTLLGEMLRDDGYTVALWDGLEDPLVFIQRSEPDVLILDIRLGHGVTIWSVLDQLDRLAGIRVPRVLVCSADSAFLREHGQTLQDRSCGIVEKPFNIDDLLAAVEDCLALSRR